jgi:protein-S-isoprenylcysteine O-methyltransferase Ste14
VASCPIPAWREIGAQWPLATRRPLPHGRARHARCIEREEESLKAGGFPLAENITSRSIAADRPGPPSRTRLALSSVAALGALGALLFIPAGRLDWVAGWLYFGIVVINVAINYVCLRRWNPELIERRIRLGDGTKTWDKVWAGLYAPVFLSIYAVAGLDTARYGWSAMSSGWWPVGLALFLLGTALLTWSMVVNPFFEKTVRIQTERGHRVIDTGPYRFVRHPGYLGFLGWIFSAPLLLGSWWAFIPSFLSGVGLLLRTALEDRTLRQELAGYAPYAQRVRFRLIPGLW